MSSGVALTVERGVLRATLEPPTSRWVILRNPGSRQHVWRIDLSCPGTLAPASADPVWLRNAKAACRSALASGRGGARSPAPKRRTPAKSRRGDVVANPYQARSAPELRAAGWTQEKLLQKLLRQGYSLHWFQRVGLMPW